MLKIVGDEWPLQHRHVLGQAIRIRSPYVDALSVTQVLALGSLRKRVDKEELTHGQKENYAYLITCAPFPASPQACEKPRADFRLTD